MLFYIEKKFYIFAAPQGNDDKGLKTKIEKECLDGCLQGMEKGKVIKHIHIKPHVKKKCSHYPNE